MIKPCQFIKVSQRLNQVRTARAQAGLTLEQRHLYNLIPFLFHIHDVHFPGYNGQLTARGIRQFALTEQIIAACEYFKLPLANVAESEQESFDGIYAMGSAGSFGQSHKSDIDVWLVHDTSLCCEDIFLLNQKAQKLTEWFAVFELEVNFYMIHPRQFIDGHPHRCEGKMEMAHEHSGSAQHWLLLEEFYRTHVKLAGKTLAWWPEVKSKCPFLNLGEVSQLPASEYFGASLWQLYKGLETPHKALLKVLLLEAYASEYPNTQLLCETVWNKTLSEDFSATNDAYYLLFEKIEHYLIGKGDSRRLELVRRCFYLKCGIKLSDETQPKDWRYGQMTKLVSQWEWPDSLIETLDNCENWHSGNLQWFNGQLNELMLASYQTLLQFASKQGLREGLRVDELGLLTRKLHTYFSDDKDQIQQLNRLWSHSIAEENLTIVHSRTNQEFYLYRQRPERQYFMGESAIYVAKSPIATIMWACLNGVATPETQWHEYGQPQGKSNRLNEAAKSLLDYIDTDKAKVSKRDLCQPWHIRKLIMLVNLEQDPTQTWRGQEFLIDRMNSNVLSLGRKQQNLLGSVDAICLNSWGEWHCHHFEGEEALLKAAAFITPGLRRSSEDTTLIEVISCSEKLKYQLENVVSKFFRKVSRLCHKTNPASTLVQPLQLGEKKFGIFFNNSGLAYEDMASSQVQEPSLSQQCPPISEQVLSTEYQDQDIPLVIQDFAASGAIQYFLHPQGNRMEVFVLNEDNELNFYTQEDINIEALVTKVSHHYAFDQPEQLNGKFNLPQFFKLLTVEGKIKAVPFGIELDELEIEF